MAAAAGEAAAPEDLELAKAKPPRAKIFELDAKGRNVEERSSFLSQIFFSYVTPLVLFGYKNTLTKQDMWPIAKQDECEVAARRFEKLWEAERQRRGKKASLFRVVFQFFRRDLIIVSMQQAVSKGGQLLQPWILQEFLLWFALPWTEEHKGYLWAASFFLIPFVAAIMDAASQHRCVRGLIQIRAVLGKLVYEKSLRMSSVAPAVMAPPAPKKRKKRGCCSPKKRQGSTDSDTEDEGGPQQETPGLDEATTGKIVNLMSVDAEKVGMMFLMLPQAVMVPFQFTANIALIYETMKGSTFVGLSMLIIFLPIMLFSMAMQVKFTAQQAKLADLRLKVVNEVLQGIRVVKFYAWEKSFIKRISDIRKVEVWKIFWATFSFQGVIFTFSLFPIGIPLASFAVYVATVGELNAVEIFRTMAYYQALQFPLIFIPIVVAQVGVGLVSARRVQLFLDQGELDKALVTPVADDGGITVEGSFAYGKDSFTLDNIKFKAAQGKLTAIVGNVGSGKSTLVLSMLGEVSAAEGTTATVKRSGSVALAAQKAWIQTMSIRENILFGLPFDEQKYRHAIEVCALERDIETLQHGDATEIGDRGINLSGGQKQRISLARAVYSGCQTVILDDPLSAVDANVGDHIMNKCFVKALAGTTRVLVMNQLHFLPKCDYIYVLEKGRITASGTYAELKANNQQFVQMMAAHEAELGSQQPEEKPAPAPEPSLRNTVVVAEVGDFGDASPTAAEIDAKEKAKGTNQQIQEEAVNVGNIGLSVYMQHARKMGLVTIFFYLLFSIVSQGSISLAVFVLNWWSERRWAWETRDYLLLYGGVGLAGGLFVFVRGAVFCYGTMVAATRYHRALFDKAMHAPSNFYDTTPVGRVLNRFTKDMSDIDIQMPRFLQSTLNMLLMVLGSLISTAVMTPIFLISAGICLFLFTALQRTYSRPCTQLKRMESVSRSPVYNHFSETILGSATIRAYEASTRFRNKNNTNLNFTAQAFYSVRMVLQWANVRIGFLNAVLSFSAALFCVTSKGDMAVGDAALAIYSVLGIGPLLGFLIINLTELDNVMNSVERVGMSNKEIPTEPNWDGNEVEVPADWPAEGRIEFDQVCFKYRPDLPLVLDSLSAVLNPNDKVGVAGRTGSGKSSLMLVLFRMYEPSGGCIRIDGIDISKVGLHTLRKRLAIIPQDPVLFSGNMRNNLDPFDEYPDDELWGALEQVQLKDHVLSMSGGLQAAVKEYGENLSVGQRQLVCIARAILRKPKILVLDEATSSVDSATDALIQTTVRTRFSSCTTLTIAHRLNTIMDSTKLMVLDSGRLAEFDEPWKLVERGGLLAQMHKAMATAHGAH